jgi:hypothetical protein
MILEQARLKRREDALQKVQGRAGPLPRLHDLLEGRVFDGATRWRNRSLPGKVKEIFGGDPTFSQRTALEVAFRTPDIALILGPPGTGKTRVLQALLAMLAEGSDSGAALETVLVTSFQHEAVDNAISGVSVAGLPVDRQGGRRNEDRGADFVRGWAARTADAVEEQLPPGDSASTELCRRLQELLAHWRESPGGRDGTRTAIETFRNEAGRFLSPDVVGELERLASACQSVPLSSGPVLREDEERARLECLLGEQAVTSASFAVEGPRRAARLLRFLRGYANDLSPDVIEAVERAAGWSSRGEEEPWRSLEAACRSIRAQLLDPPAPSAVAEQDVADEAVDRCLTACLQEVRAARFSPGNVDDALRLFAAHLRERTDEVRETLRQYLCVQAVSCGQADSRRFGLRDRTFSVVIADEAARANPLDLLIPLAKGRRIILVGDHKQLPHVLEPEIERELDRERADQQLRELYKKSLFERLWEHLEAQFRRDNIPRQAELTDQFRMHPVIGEFVSRHFYNGRLKSDKVSPDARPNQTGAYGCRPIVWLDVPRHAGPEKRVGKSWCRDAEAQRIVEELRRILPRLVEQHPDIDPGHPRGMVGVIAFYSAQEDKLLQALEDEQAGLPESLRKRVHVGTVDAFQGREYDVVYLSTVRSNANQGGIAERLGFTALPNRLCVAFSRARCVLVGVGDSACVGGLRPDGQPWSPPMKAFIDLARSQGHAEF